jgi:uncharacterized membrane protein required for colicin V production
MTYMIAMATQSLELDKLPVGWFDFMLVAVLGFGLFRGQKNGMTKEVLPMLQWVAIVLLCGFGYETVGLFFTKTFGLDVTPAFILGYLSLALLVFFVFVMLKKVLMPRLTGSNFFGGSEYYLGMISGMIRFVCVLFFGLALLNAPFYTAAEIKARQVYVDRWYGANYFPGIQDTQSSVFQSSFAGRFIKENLGVILINTGAIEAKATSAPANKPMIKIGN